VKIELRRIEKQKKFAHGGVKLALELPQSTPGDYLRNKNNPLN